MRIRSTSRGINIKKMLVIGVLAGLLLAISCLLGSRQHSNAVELASPLYDGRLGQPGGNPPSSVYDLASAHDGSLWILGYNSTGSLYHIGIGPNYEILSQTDMSQLLSLEGFWPEHITIGEDGYIYVFGTMSAQSDTLGYGYAKYDVSGNLVKIQRFSDPGNGTSDSNYAGGAGTTVVDASGNIYITNGNFYNHKSSHSIDKYSSSGIMQQSIVPALPSEYLAITINEGNLYALAFTDGPSVPYSTIVISTTDNQVLRSFEVPSLPYGSSMDCAVGLTYNTGSDTLSTYCKSTGAYSNSGTIITFDANGAQAKQNIVLDENTENTHLFALDSFSADAANNLYYLNQTGSITMANLDSGELREIRTSDFKKPIDSMRVPSLITGDQDGNIYVFDSVGYNPDTGEYGPSTIVKYSADREYLGRQQLDIQEMDLENMRTLLIDSNQNAYIAGRFYNPTIGAQCAIGRFSIAVDQAPTDVTAVDCLLRLSDDNIPYYIYSVNGMVLTDAGKLLVVGLIDFGNTQPVAILDLATGVFEPLAAIQGNGDINSIAIGPDGQYYMTSRYGYYVDDPEASYNLLRYDPKSQQLTGIVPRDWANQEILTFTSIRVDSAGDFYIGGISSYAGNPVIVKYAHDGTPLMTVATSGNNEDQLAYDHGAYGVLLDGGLFLSNDGKTIYAASLNGQIGLGYAKIYLLDIAELDPPHLSIQSITPSSVNVSWTVSSYDTHDKITGFKLQYRAVGASDWTIIDIPGDARSYTISGLSESTEYEFMMIAINRFGQSPLSNMVTAIPNAMPPGVPNTGQKILF